MYPIWVMSLYFRPNAVLTVIALAILALPANSVAQESGGRECKTMQATSGDVAVPVRVCRDPGGVWHRVETPLAPTTEAAFRGHLVYAGQFSGNAGRIQRTPASLNLGRTRIDLGFSTTAYRSRRDVTGTARIDLAIRNGTMQATMALAGPGLNQRIALGGAVRAGACALDSASGDAHFAGTCTEERMTGKLVVENASGWRLETGIDAMLQSRQNDGDAALAAAAERQRQQESQRAQAERISLYIGKLTLRARGGDVDAMGTLGDIYSDDSVVSADLQKAVYWYGMAAGHNDPRAMFNLALSYAKGEGVGKNSTIASDLYAKCARIASKYQPDCARNLGLAYALGEGVPQSKKTALFWLRACARMGDSKCDEIANVVERN